MNIPKSINDELETFVIDMYVTVYVFSYCRIPHFLASVLTEYLTSRVSVSNFMVFQTGYISISPEDDNTELKALGMIVTNK